VTTSANDVLFIAGSGPGVGKTAVAVAMMRGLARIGRRVVGIKPIEVGVGHDANHDLIAPDGDRLGAASVIAVPPLVRAPYRFNARAVPTVAALRSGIELGLEELVSAVKTACEYGQLVVVDGIGGLLTPIATDGATIDLAGRLGATVVLVVPDAAGSESVLLCGLEACRRRALKIAGYVLTQTAGPVLGEDELALLRARAGARQLLTLDLNASEAATNARVDAEDAAAAVVQALAWP